MALRLCHGVWYGLMGMAWYMVWPIGYGMVYGMAWWAWHGMWYSLAGITGYILWL